MIRRFILIVTLVGTLCGTLSAPLCAFAAHRNFVVFDLDRTLFDPNPRIARILHDIGSEKNLPSLLRATPAQVEALVAGDRSVLGLPEATLREVFGTYADGSNRSSPFGKKFYFDSSYLVHDGVIPGGAEFVERISRLLDAEVIYLSGRLDAYFRAGTLAQLSRHDFPGFGNRSEPAHRTHLLLKKESAEKLQNDEFKIEELKRMIGDGRVVAVFDDSGRNLAKFKEWLPTGVPIVRIAHSSTKPSEVTTDGTIRIRDYTSDPALIGEILKRAKACSILSGG
ncbi:MAG: hypothetical protein EBX52_03915 [Proteobacteria bacterium]|nr:hypothetical protein [Pseudomonadota bacterium]